LDSPARNARRPFGTSQLKKLEELGEAILGFDDIEQVDQWLGSAAAPAKE
jgi:hypothetical protein